MTAVRRLSSKDFDGYLKRRLPHKLDRIVDAVVDEYRAGSPATRSEMLNDLDPAAAGTLSAYGQRSAALAVRRRSLDTLRRGLVGMAMADGALEDYRDNLIVLAAIDHSAGLLGTDLGALVEELADAIPPRAKENFASFATRATKDRSLRAMGLAASGTGDEFLYVSG